MRMIASFLLLPAVASSLRVGYSQSALRSESPHGWIRQESRTSEQPAFFHMHIPKTGGWSLSETLTRQHWLPDGAGLWTDEICWYPIQKKMKETPGKSYMITTLRHPTMHVYSQFLAIGNCDFAKNIHEYIDYFHKHGNSLRRWESFYNSVNMQTRAFVCHSDEEQSGIHQIEGPVLLEEAKANLNATDFVFILEHYKESLCIMYARLHNAVPDYCECGKPELWAQMAPDPDISNPEISIEDLTEEDLKKVSTFTADDLQLYNFAKARFHRELADVEAKYEKKILCEGTSP